MTEKTMPPLPSGSVDVSALHEAEAKNADLDKAIVAATTRKEVPTAEQAPEPAAVGTGGFELTSTGGGWWQISGPGLDAPEKHQGEEAARARFNELIAAVADDDGSATETSEPGIDAGAE